jgi:hypothetical protein
VLLAKNPLRVVTHWRWIFFEKPPVQLFTPRKQTSAPHPALGEHAAALTLVRHGETNLQDNISVYSTPVLRTPWTVEKQANLSYTHKMFSIF